MRERGETRQGRGSSIFASILSVAAFFIILSSVIPAAHAAYVDGTCVWNTLDYYCEVNVWPSCGAGYHLAGTACTQNLAFSGTKIAGSPAPCNGGYTCCQDQVWCKDTDRDGYYITGCNIRTPGTYIINCIGDPAPAGYIAYTGTVEDCNDNDFKTNPGILPGDTATPSYVCGTDYNCDGNPERCYSGTECMSDCGHGNWAMTGEGTSFYICKGSDMSAGYRYPCTCQPGYREAYFDAINYDNPLVAGKPPNADPPDISARESFKNLLLNPPLAQEVQLKNPFVYPPYMWSCFPQCTTPVNGNAGTCATSSPQGDIGAKGKINANCLSGTPPGTPTQCYNYFCDYDYGASYQCFQNGGCTDNSMCNQAGGYTCRTSTVSWPIPGPSVGTKLAGWCQTGTGGACANYNNCGANDWCSSGHCCNPGTNWNGLSCAQPGTCVCGYAPVNSANYLKSGCIDIPNRQSCLNYTNSVYGPGTWQYYFGYAGVLI